MIMPILTEKGFKEMQEVFGDFPKEQLNDNDKDFLSMSYEDYCQVVKPKRVKI